MVFNIKVIEMSKGLFAEKNVESSLYEETYLDRN
jgi:hypothetical protein